MMFILKKVWCEGGNEGRWVKWVGEKGCQTENTHLECFTAAEKWVLLARSIYYDTAYLKTIVKRKTAHYSSSNAMCHSLLKLAGFLLHQLRQEICFCYMLKCLDFSEFGSSAHASPICQWSCLGHVGSAESPGLHLHKLRAASCSE